MNQLQPGEALLSLDSRLLGAVVEGTQCGLQMTGAHPVPIGASRLLSTPRQISVLVGLVGRSNGTFTLNLSEGALLFLAGRLLAEEQTEVNEDNFDAACEIGNMIAGSIKDSLEGTEFETEHLSVPALVLGASYKVFYARGITSVSVEFELEDLPVTRQEDRFFTASLSLMTQIA